MSLNAEPLKQENDLVRLIDEGIAALLDDGEFETTLEAIEDSRRRVGGGRERGEGDAP